MTRCPRAALLAAFALLALAPSAAAQTNPGQQQYETPQTPQAPQQPPQPQQQAPGGQPQAPGAQGQGPPAQETQHGHAGPRTGKNSRPSAAKRGGPTVLGKHARPRTSPGLFESARGALPFTGFHAAAVLLAGAATAAAGLALRRSGRRRTP